jgi:hypothetical protein
MSHGGRGWVALYREAAGGGQGGRRRTRERKKKRKKLGLAARVAWGFAVSWKVTFCRLLSWCCFSPRWILCFLPLFIFINFQVYSFI